MKTISVNVKRGDGVLLALNQLVETPYGTGRVVWFSYGCLGDAVVHVSIDGEIKKVSFSAIGVHDGTQS